MKDREDEQHEEIDLSEDDEAALDAAWERLDKELPQSEED